MDLSCSGELNTYKKSIPTIFHLNLSCSMLLSYLTCTTLLRTIIYGYGAVPLLPSAPSIFGRF